jgi:hypothetical protein
MQTPRLLQQVGGARTIALLAVFLTLAWIKMAGAWEHKPTYPRHLRHRHVITTSPAAVAQPLPPWHRDAG